MTWTARIISEGETEQEATGEYADDAAYNLLLDIMTAWKRGEYSICGDYIKEIGEAIISLERLDEDEATFASQCGDFSQPWKLVVTRNPCDQLGNGCTCEECTSQIADACGIVYDGTPVDLDSPEYDDDDCESV
jgi:hypothetical protein